MNRRAFIKLLSASAMVPIIGLPAVAPGAPATGISVEQAAELAKITLQDMPQSGFVIYIDCGYSFICVNRRAAGFLVNAS